MNRITRNIETDRFIYRITSAYERGGINTLSWHQYDPHNRGFYAEDVNNERIVATILPGGDYHDNYKEKLFEIARVMKGLRGTDSHSIPIIFRPYHEHDGGWFWWGVGHCTSEEYNALWRFTTTYLQDSLNVHNFIYTLSPSQFNDREDYLDPYPGDDQIDLIGMDFYFDYPVTSAERNQFLKRLRIVSQLAQETNKIAALTEVGQEGLKTINWYTNVLLVPLKYDSIATAVSYAAVWRNANATHHFAPYPGHASVPDFLAFYNDPYVVFEADLPNMYSEPTADTTPPYFTVMPDKDIIATATLITLEFETNERAFLRYSTEDESFEIMPFDFQHGQGRTVHSTTIPVQHDECYTFYVRAADCYGNVMDTSAVVQLFVDTLRAPVYWNDRLYDDSNWRLGKAPLGYGNISDSTVLEQEPTLFFRRSFTLTDSVKALGLLVKCHDGAVAYINGHEIGRANMPDGNIDENTPALSALKSSKVFVLDTEALAALIVGTNVIAVEVHQAVTVNPDISFDARLFNQTDIFVDLGSCWLYYPAGGRPPDQTLRDIQSAIWRNYSDVPASHYLYQNYPNPFNPNTNIPYTLFKTAFVTLEIFDITGQKVATPINQKEEAGYHTTIFETNHLPNGIYVYRLTVGNSTQVKKMLLLK